MRNIGYVYTVFPLGGAERSLQNLAPELTKLGYKVFVFTSEVREDLFTTETKQCITIIKIDSKKGDDKCAEIIKKAQENSIELMLFSDSSPIIYKEQIYLAKALPCPTIFVNHGKIFWEITDRIESIKEKRSRSKSILKKWRYSALLYMYEKSRYCRFYKVRRKYKALVEANEKYVVLCNEYRNDMLDMVNVDRQKVLAITNGIPEPPIQYSMDKEKVVIYVGRLTRNDKRVDRLLYVYDKIHSDFPEWKLKIVGDGPEREKLEYLAKELKLRNIEFCGFTSNPFKYYNEASIICLTSHHEGFGMVLIEAQQAGVIPVAFSCSSGVGSIISDNWGNGVLVEPYDLDEYVRSLRKLMSDEELRRKMQKCALEKSKEFSITNVAMRWDSLFKQVLK